MKLAFKIQIKVKGLRRRTLKLINRLVVLVSILFLIPSVSSVELNYDPLVSHIKNLVETDSGFDFLDSGHSSAENSDF